MNMATRIAQRYAKKGNLRLADGENYMSLQSLQGMVDHANALLGKINEGTDLPDWVEAKIIRAAASLEDVMEFFEHGQGARLASMDTKTPLKVGDKVNLISSEGTIAPVGYGGAGVGEVQEIDRDWYWVKFPNHSYKYQRKSLHLIM